MVKLWYNRPLSPRHHLLSPIVECFGGLGVILGGFGGDPNWESVFGVTRYFYATVAYSNSLYFTEGASLFTSIRSNFLYLFLSLPFRCSCAPQTLNGQYLLISPCALPLFLRISFIALPYRIPGLPLEHFFSFVNCGLHPFCWLSTFRSGYCISFLLLRIRILFSLWSWRGRGGWGIS